MYATASTEPITWNTAIYVRISDREKKKGLYDSIENQIDILKEYAEKKELTNIRIFADEHEKGGNFDRPQFNKMIDEIKAGTINCVMFKDLSRFGREHIEGDYFLEILLPQNNVRLISKMEGIDSHLDPKRMNSIEIPLINLFNEQYLRQVSNSTKASLKMKRKEGKFVGSRVPYGYLRSPEDKHKLIVDADVRDIIKDIFRMYLNNLNLYDIARSLNAKDVLTPSQYAKKLKGDIVNYDSLWNGNTVKHILSNHILTGDMVQGLTVSYSHKVKKRVPLPKEKWTIVENTHEAIIDKETFEMVQVLIKKQSRPTIRKQKTPPSVLAGFLECGDCHGIMQRTTSVHNGKKYYHMICSAYKKLGSKACTNHLIAEGKVIDVLLETINKIIFTMLDIEKTIRDNRRDEISKIRAKLKHELSITSAERDKISKIKTELYGDYKQDIISLEDYKDMKERFESKYTVLNYKILKLTEDIKQLDNGGMYNTDVTNTFKKHEGVTEITRELLGDLVEKVIIDKDKNVRIVFKFQDEIKKIINILSLKLN